MKKAVALVAVAGMAAVASAQSPYEIQIDVANPTLGPGQSTSVTLSATHDDWAVAGIGTDFISSVGSEGWSDLALVAPMDGPGTSAGDASATGVDGIIAGQLNFPPAMIFADPSSPIAFWQATYTAPDDVTDGFDVDLSTSTSRFDIYIDEMRSTSESRLDDLVEGSGTISVVPAPASLALLGLGGLAAARRRR